MKIITTCLALCLGFCALVLAPVAGLRAQSGTWVWMNGSDTANSTGVYGVQGVGAASNTPPALYQAAQWKDKQGNLWIFGGLDCQYNERNDIWKFDPSNNTWTWVRGTGTGLQPGIYGVKGVPSVNNTPGARAWGCASWTDSVGDLWLLGGCGYDSAGIRGDLNDLWKYNIASNEWTWMAGASTPAQPPTYGTLQQPSDSATPSSRSEENTAWIDNANNLWLYGGRDDGNTLGYDDMWRFNISTGEWTWMGGSKQPGKAARYGQLGIESSGAFPGARSSFVHWADSNYLYLSGGTDWVGNKFNDVWRYNLATNYWTWVGGSAGNVDSGKYTHYCSSEYGDMPVGRIEQRSAQVAGCSTRLFMWGGGSAGGWVLNDLWSFDTHSATWRWLSGYDSISPPGNYGSKGVASPSNIPRGASGGCFWSDNQNNLWLWGGQTLLPDSVNNEALFLNALWKYIPDLACFPVDTGFGNLNYQLSQTSLCPGDSATITVSGDSVISISPDNSVTWLSNSEAVLRPDSTTIYTVVGTTACKSIAIENITIQVAKAVDIVSDKTIACAGDTVQICAPNGYGTYKWSNGDTTVCINTSVPGNYDITATQNGNCSITSNVVKIYNYPSAYDSLDIIGDTLVGPVASSYQWYLGNDIVTGATSQRYVAHLSGEYSVQIIDSNGCVTKASGQLTINPGSDNYFTIFPNPTTANWQMVVSPEWLGGELELYDDIGRRIFKTTVDNLQTIIGVTELASAVYELRVSRPGLVIARKLVKLQE